MKIICTFLILLFIVLISAPDLTIYGAGTGLSLWFQNVLPTLLPLMFIGLMIARTNASKWLGRLLKPVFHLLFGIRNEYGAVAILMGLLCGYPMGGVICTDFLCQGKLTRNEYRYLMSFCNLPSPMFIFGLIWTTVLQRCISLPVLVLCFYGAMLATSIISRRIIKPFSLQLQENSKASDAAIKKSYTDSPDSREYKDSFPDILEAATEHVLLVITKIGLYMMIVCACLQHLSRLIKTNSMIVSCILSAILEMTSGINLAATAYESGGLGRLPFLLLCLVSSGFGGLCVCMQISSATKNASYSMKEYLAWKLLYAAVMTLIVLLTEWAK